MLKQAFSLFICLLGNLLIFAQQPTYSKKQFVTTLDTVEFKRTGNEQNGFGRTYILFDVPIWDLDDNNTTHVKTGQKAVVCIEGNYKNGMRDGVFKWYLIDSLDHSRRYRIWEQTYLADRLNGEWREYNLKGTVVQMKTFRNDSLNGIARDYWIDGKTIINEIEYFDGESKYLHRKYQKNGKPDEEIMMVNKKPDGEGKKYYPSGIVKSRVRFKSGLLDGPSTYYYPNGKPWIQEIYKAGKKWTVVANFDSKGKKRDPGTLKDGNGTLILYDDDTTIREVVVYKNGVIQK